MNAASRARERTDRKVVVSLLSLAYGIMLVGFLVEFSLIDKYVHAFGLLGIWVALALIVGAILYLVDRQFVRSMMQNEP